MCLNFLIGLLAITPYIFYVIFTQLPIFLYRLVLTKIIAPTFYPGIGKAVTTNAQFQATEFLGDEILKFSKYGIAVTLTIGGSISLDELCQLVLKRWIHKKDPSSSKLLYPEFTQYIESWFGFMFWKQDYDFHIHNHIICHDLNLEYGSVKSHQFLEEFVEDLLNKPYHRYRSPWELHLARNHNFADTPNLKEETFLVFRCHHAMASGFAVYCLLVEALFGDCVARTRAETQKQYFSTPKEIRKSVGFCASFLHLLYSPFLLLADFGMIVRWFLSPQYPWTKQGNPKEQIVRQFYARSPLISMEKLKFIKNSFHVSLSSVILSCISTSLAKHLHQVNPHSKWKTLRTSMMLPTMKTQDNKLRNNTMGTLFELNTKIDLNPEERLVITEETYCEARDSLLPKILWPIYQIFSGSLATPFATIVKNNRSVPVGFSNMPGPSTKFKMDYDREVTMSTVATGSFSDVFFTMYSYDGSMSICVAAGSNVLDKIQIEGVVREICMEIEKLYVVANCQV